MEKIKTNDIETMEDLNYIAKITLNLWVFINIVLSLAYVPSVVTGKIHVIYGIIFYLLLWVPWILSKPAYRNQNYNLVKHLLGGGYGLFFLYSSFISNNIMSLLYVYPMLIIVTIWQDYKYTLRIGICNISLVLAHTVIYFMSGSIDRLHTNYMIILFALSVFMTVFTTYSAIALVKLNEKNSKE